MFAKDDDRRVMGTEEAHAITIQDLLDTKDLKAKTMTDLNDEEVGVLALLQTIGDSLDIAEIKAFVTHFAQFRVSRNRLGRREMKEIVTNAGNMDNDIRRRRSIKDLFQGIKT
jgi:hypothetical protein